MGAKSKVNIQKRYINHYYAVLAALFYALNVPVAKILLKDINEVILAGLLYLGAGIGMTGVVFFGKKNVSEKEKPFEKKDVKYIFGMIVLDIFAPIFLMTGLNKALPENVSLLNNFEIVVTSLIAYFIFREKISKRLATGLFLVTLSTIILSFQGIKSFSFSEGSLFVILACCCWGLENNCTRMLSQSDPKKIVIIKGIGSGLTAFLIGVFLRYPLPSLMTMIYSLCLGFVSYGLSVYYYVKAQRYLGASRTSAYYALTPFIGVILSLVLFREMPTVNFWIALVVMGIGIFFTN